MISFEMKLIPFGYMKSETIIYSRIWTTNDGKFHGYRVYKDGGETLVEGKIEKTKSGHQNPLHLLSNLLADIDLEALGENYISTVWDLPKDQKDDK